MDLSAITSALEQEILEHDINHIIKCYKDDLATLTFTFLHMPPNSCRHTHYIYQKILGIISEKSVSPNLLEIMPLIDDYLEYISATV